MTQKKLLSLILPVSVALFITGCTTTQPYHSESSIHKTTWSYMGEMAPEYWGDITGYELCKTGVEQSPININKVQASNENAPLMQYTVSDLDVINNGHTIVYTPTNQNNITTLGSDTYVLKQFHYHAPSEHQLSGTNYPAEFHFVHANAMGKLAVVGVMLNPSSHNNSLNQLIDSSLATTRSGQKVLAKNVNLTSLIPSNKTFYHYEGSLTTPPCSEQVSWYISDTPLAISATEIKVLKSIYSNNNRPIQPIGERKVIQVQ